MFEKLAGLSAGDRFRREDHRLIEAFARKENAHFIDQLRRAAVSISLNIAEGNDRWHVRDRGIFFWIARGSAFECLPLIELCRRKELITGETYQELRRDIEVICKMLTALIRTTDNRK